MEPQRCILCKNVAPLPLLACFVCVQTHDCDYIATPTYYCDTRCRLNDKLSHRTACRNNTARTNLICASKFLQLTYRTLRIAAFDLKIKRIEKRGGVPHMYDDSYLGNNGCCPLYLFPFEPLANDDDRAAVATHLTCNDAIGSMYELSKELFQGLTTTVEEIKVHIGVSWKVIRYFQDGNQDRTRWKHAVLAVECIDGEAYIIDLTGSQFGQHRVIIRLREYMMLYPKRIFEIHPHGTTHDFLASTIEGKNNLEFPEDFDFRPIQVQHQLHQVFMHSKTKWEKQETKTVRDLALLRDGATYDHWWAFNNTIKAELAAFLVDREKGGFKDPPHPGPKPLPFDPMRSQLAKPKCTIEPVGKGSRAYRRWLKDERANAEVNEHGVPDWVKMYMNAGTILHYM